MSQALNHYRFFQQNLHGDVYFDEITRYLLSTDASMYHVLPLGVIYPKDIDDVVMVMRYCFKHGIPVHPRGGGSGLGGQSLGHGIILDFTRYMNRVLEFNEHERFIITEPGARLGDLDRLARKKGYFIPPDPSSKDYSAIGGNVGTNASGAHSVKYGNIADYIEELEVVLANGEILITRDLDVTSQEFKDIISENTLEARIYKEMYALLREHHELIENGYPDVKYNVSGYALRGVLKENIINLKRVFIGAEGSLGVITKIKLRFTPLPKHEIACVAYFNDLQKAGKAVVKTLAYHPSAVEIMDDTLLNIAREQYPKLNETLPKDLRYMLLIEFDGPDLVALTRTSETLGKELRDNGLAFYFAAAASKEEKDKLWEARKAAVPLLYKISLHGRKIQAVIEDGVVPPEQLPAYMQALYDIGQKYDVPLTIYGHAGKGLLHVRPLLNLKVKQDIELMKTISREAFNHVKALGGVFSGEHGDGRVRGGYLKELYGAQLFSVFKRVKHIFDPNNLLNPDVKINASLDKLASNLRYGETYSARVPDVLHLHWEMNEYQDEIEKCHGCSKCTTPSVVVTMCPVYKGKHTEFATPKAKANIFRGIISDAIAKEHAFDSPLFKELIFNCVGCQSCVHECPSNVNIPKIALEAKAEYVKRHGSSLREWLLGSLGLIGKFTHYVASITNYFSALRLTRFFMEKTIGITRHRVLPKYSRQTFSSWYKNHQQHRVDTSLLSPSHLSRKVVYFVGCSAEYTSPEIGKALVEVMEKNGVEIIVPNQSCCGLPMFTYGNVDRAKKYVKYNVRQFLPYVKEGYDIIVTCSSCGLSLKQEWQDLLHNDDTKLIAEHTFHVSEYLLKLKEEHALNTKDLHAINVTLGYHTPCHLKAQSEAKESSLEILRLIPNADVHHVDEGCCGICGSWGYKKENYEISLQIGKPMIDSFNANPFDFAVTDCPTCTLQIEHATDKPVQHPIQLLALAYHEDTS